MVSSISFWELGVKQGKGKIDLGAPLDEFCRRVADTGILEILPVDLTTWQAALELDWEHRDPVDRVVVATAKTRGLTLVTADERIAKYYKKAAW
jgi:PIN domain nuclease of toxin-antitoxin system